MKQKDAALPMLTKIVSSTLEKLDKTQAFDMATMLNSYQERFSMLPTTIQQDHMESAIIASGNINKAINATK